RKADTVDYDRTVETWSSDTPSAHDLRRTLATRLAGAGVPAEDISACLNHTRGGVPARHYDLYDRAREKRKAFELWGRQAMAIALSHLASKGSLTVLNRFANPLTSLKPTLATG